ncbi:MAG: glutathione S-transferase C-terminal domain-containing protein [Pseudomonadota bacterium]
MLTLYTFGPAFGLPDPSPFCIKAMVLLKMSGLDFECIPGDVRKAPKLKMPYLVDDGKTIADSTFVRWHLEARYSIDFDKDYDAASRATGWAMEKLCEDHLYWLGLHERWMEPVNFDKGPRMFFDAVPAILRPLIVHRVKSDVRRNLWGQGTGRHSEAERNKLANTAIQTLSDCLGDKPYLLGATPSGADASVFATTLSCSCPHFDTPSRRMIEAHPNLIAYRDRLNAEWFGSEASS